MKNHFVLFLLVMASMHTCVSAQSSGVQLNARVYLEGALMDNNNAYSTTGRPLMRDHLRLSPFSGLNYIPLLDPYKFEHANLNIVSKYQHVPANQAQEMHEIVDTNVLDVSGQDAIVDWIFIELRSPSDSTMVVATRSCLVQRDGDVVDLDGVSPVNFPDVSGNQFYVAIHHRSHLAAMTRKTDVTKLIDFTKQNVPMYDFGVISNTLNYKNQAQNNGVKYSYWALWAGDFSADGMLKGDGPNDDLSFLYADVVFHPANTEMSASFDNAIGYYNSDFNMNSKLKFQNPSDDKNMMIAQCLFYINNSNFLTNYNFFIEQLPK